MIPVRVEGVRRNFLPVSAFLYSVTLLDEAEQRFMMFGIERHEALPIVATLNNLTLPRPETLYLMAETLKLLGNRLEGVSLENFSALPPVYHLCQCRLRWRNGEAVQEEARLMRPSDAIGLALLMEAPLSASERLFQHIGGTLTEGQTPELIVAYDLLKREGITLPASKKLRLGYSKTPLRDALVKELKASLLGKAPVFPEEDMEQKKKEYLAFILGESI